MLVGKITKYKIEQKSGFVFCNLIVSPAVVDKRRKQPISDLSRISNDKIEAFFVISPGFVGDKIQNRPIFQFCILYLSPHKERHSLWSDKIKNTKQVILQVLVFVF